MFFFRKKKIDKAAWAALIFEKSPQNIEKVSEERLNTLTSLMLMQHFRIIADSARIALATKNDETRRSRTDLSLHHYNEMVKFEPYCNTEQLEILRQAEALIQKLP